MATTIGEICNREVIITMPDSTVADAAKLMREQHVGSIVVLDRQRARARGCSRRWKSCVTRACGALPIVRDGQLVGIVTLDDLLEILAEQTSALLKIIAREQKRENDMTRGVSPPSWRGSAPPSTSKEEVGTIPSGAGMV